MSQAVPGKNSESAVPSSRRAAANFDDRLLSLQEEVQQRIASDLHDSTCQHLIAASLNTMRMRCSIGDIASATKICDDIDASIDQALREIRSFTYLLNPQNLRDEGLKAAIEQFVGGFCARTSLKTHFEIAPEVDKLSYEKQRSVLRVIQEALMNVFRHANATQVTVAIVAADASFKLRISDDGCGLPANQTTTGPKAISFGVGIPAMRLRLQQLGSALEIRSSSAPECRGTTLLAVIPCPDLLKKTRPERSPERRYRGVDHHKSVAEHH